MKKVVFIIDNLKGGGAEKAIKIIIEGLQDKGINPILILLENKLDYEINKSIQIYSLSDNISKYNFIFLYFKLISLLKKIQPDIIYATNTKSQILSLLSKYFYKAKRSINIQVDLTKQYENRKLIFKLFNKLLNFADGYSFISHGIYNNLKNKIPNKECFFIPNPIDFKEIDRLKLEAIDEEDIFSKKVIVNVGRLTKQKGQWILLEAFAKLNNPEYNLIILGVGEKEEELKQLSKTLKIADKVYFLGFKSNPFKYLYNSDIFVLSSLWEGFGNVIVEAMRCELPIVSSDCPSGPREIISPNDDKKFGKCEYGVLVKVDDSEALKNGIIECIDSKEYYKRQSIKRSYEYSKEKIVDKFIKCFL